MLRNRDKLRSDGIIRRSRRAGKTRRSSDFGFALRTYVQTLPLLQWAVLCTDDATCLFAGLLGAGDGTRTHDLLHGKDDARGD
jgi:hypothetical protein